MGQEIVYCFKCQNRLLGSDFERGKAFHVDGKAACAECVRVLLAHLPDPDKELERLKRTQSPKPSGGSGSSSRIKIERGQPGEFSTRFQAPPAGKLSAGGSATPKARLPLYLAVAGGIVAAAILLVMISSPSDERRPKSGSLGVEPGRLGQESPPQVPFTPDSLTLLARELEEIDARTLLLIRQERLQEVSRILVSARGNHGALQWQRGIDERMEKLEAVARRLAAPLLDQVGPAVKKGDEAGEKVLRSRLEGLGVPALIAEYEKAVATAVADPWIELDLQSLVSGGGAVLSNRNDRAVLVSGANPTRDTLQAEARVGLKRVLAFRIEALSDPSLPGGGPGRAANGNFLLSEFRVQAAGHALEFSGASADYEQEGYPSSAALDGNPLTGWAVAGRLGQNSAAIFHLKSPVDLESITVILEHRSVHAQHVLGCFRISVCVTSLPSPPPPRHAEATEDKPQMPLQLPPAVLAYRERWGAAARLAAARDFMGAAKVLEESRVGLADDTLRKEAEADIADFKLAAGALAEVLRLLPRWAKGTKIALEFLGESGSIERLDGVVQDASARGVTIQAGDGLFEVPAGELGASSIAALIALRGEKRPMDARAVAVFAALEGRTAPDLPKRFAGVRGSLASPEAEARRLFWSAEEDYAAMKTRPAAGLVYAALLQNQTAFAMRNKAFLEDRLVGTREFLFFPEDLAGIGTFSPSTSPKMDSFWISTADSGAGKAAGNFLEIDLFVVSNVTYRAWVYAGGCCQEVFTFFLQGTGLSGPSARNPRDTVTAEPGGEEWIAVRPPSLGLKKKHADHMGPKGPDHWTWVELGALKFAGPGLKKFRILTEEKGFAVAYLAVSPTRQAPPREGEVKDLQRNRPPLDLGPTGAILREIWRGIPGDTISDLTNHPKFKDGKPDLSGPITHIDSWNMGTEYGCRIRGFVHPPVTGDYVFWIASDDHGELWLSVDDSPARKQKLCSLNHAVGQRDWNADPSQKSLPIPLVGGKRYYIEVLQKQGGGSEHVAVGWQLPGGAQERPIPPSRLSPYEGLFSRKVPRPVFRLSSEDLVGYWTFDETAGTEVADASGRGHNGQLRGDAKWGPGKSKGGLLVSTSGFVEIPDAPDLNPSAITAAAWVNLPTPPGKAGNIVSKGQNLGYRFRVGENGIVSFFDRGAINQLHTTETVPLNQWVHIAVTGEVSGLKIYLNGRQAAANTIPYAAPSTPHTFKIGAEPDYGEFFNGSIDEVCLYKRALSPREIMVLYRLGPKDPTR